MESDGTHEDSSEADSPLKVSDKVSKQQQTSWILVLYRECGVPAVVLAKVFGVGQHTVRGIATGIVRPKTVSAINSELSGLYQQLSPKLDRRLGKLLSDSFLTRELLTVVQQECLRQVEVLKVRKRGTAEKDRIQATATVITAVLKSAANPVAQTPGVLTD
jgi:hypothetical protein